MDEIAYLDEWLQHMQLEIPKYYGVINFYADKTDHGLTDSRYAALSRVLSQLDGLKTPFKEMLNNLRKIR